MRNWFKALFLTCVLSTPAVAQDTLTPINPATCKDVVTLMGYVDAANAQSPGAVVPTKIDGQGEKAGDNSVRAANAVKAYNIVYSTNYNADGLLIMYFPASESAIVGLLEDRGTSACEPKKMNATEFQAFRVLMGEPVA